MANQKLIFNNINETWIFHREEVDTKLDGSCNIYFLLDAFSLAIYGHITSKDSFSETQIKDLLNLAYKKATKWPKKILLSKKDPFLDDFSKTCKRLNLNINVVTANELTPIIRDFSDHFQNFKKGLPTSTPIEPMSDVEREELEAFIPETYGPCPCASGKKFKFCCQKIFKEITLAMCDAQDGKLNEALRFMQEAEKKVGRTAEVVCRSSIVWSFFDKEKYRSLIKEALEINPKHPRTNYISGIDAVANGNFQKALEFYQTALENYPSGDKFHLNETYNNMGTAYLNLSKYKEAKEVWEKALVLMPSDAMVKRNLVEFIYNNKNIPDDLRQISPFIEKFFNR